MSWLEELLSLINEMIHAKELRPGTAWHMKVNQLHVTVIIVIITSFRLLETSRIMHKLLDSHSRSFVYTSLPITSNIPLTHVPELGLELLPMRPLLLRCPPPSLPGECLLIMNTGLESTMSTSSYYRVAVIRLTLSP